MTPKQGSPHHQLTGSEELEALIASLPIVHQFGCPALEYEDGGLADHSCQCGNSAKVRQAFLPVIKKARVEARLATIDAVFELSPTKTFEHWKPSDALRFYERLKEYEKKIQAQLASMEEQ